MSTMEMMKRLQEISLAGKTKPGIDADWADRIAGGVGTSLIVAFAILIGAKQYFGTVIDCWTPAEFAGPMDTYVSEFCFINSTYWASEDKELPADIETREKAKLPYYQWAPWILGILALLSYVPRILWRLFSTKSGINPKFVVSRACELQVMNRGLRVGGVMVWESYLKALATYVEGSLMLRRQYKHALLTGLKRSSISRRSRPLRMFGGNMLALLYIGIKFLALAIAVVQLFILQTFLDKPTNFYGLNALSSFMRGSNWSSIGLFPRVTFCDFSVRIMGNQNQRHTVQCVLSLNMLNEKIFTFLWFWVMLIIAVIGASSISWMMKLILGYSNRNFVASYLETNPGWHENVKNNPNEELERQIYDFVHSYLGQDGVLVMRFVSWNAGVSLTAALLAKLFFNYREFKEKFDASFIGINGFHKRDSKSIELTPIPPSDHDSAE